MYIPRRIAPHLLELASYYPVVSLTGPRQAGKTTLLSQAFADYRYVSLEAPDIRSEAMADPRAFLKNYSEKVIFDEVQRVPELFNYLQGVVDQDRRPGRFILSGSQNFLLQKGITQSLAGRVGIARLYPLDLLELAEAELLPDEPDEIMIGGLYPNRFITRIPPKYFYPDYISSYLERDIAEMINAAKRAVFLQFLRVCASFAGQLVNLSQMAKMTQVSVATVRSWLSLLESSYIVFQVRPYFKNFGKRLTKSPKLYFYDTGLLCDLLGAREAGELKHANQYGAVFENLIIADRAKSLSHAGERPEFYFFRDSNGIEADLLETTLTEVTLTEIKSSSTFSDKWDKNLRKIGTIADRAACYRVVYGGSLPTRTIAGTEYRPWFEAGRP